MVGVAEEAAVFIPGGLQWRQARGCLTALCLQTAASGARCLGDPGLPQPHHGPLHDIKLTNTEQILVCYVAETAFDHGSEDSALTMRHE